MSNKNQLFKSITSSKLIPFFILLLGMLLRLIALGEIPEGMHQDEAFVSWNAFAIFREGMDSGGHFFPIYMADWGDGHSALYVWLLIPILALTGGHTASPFLSRLPQALVSIFTLWTVYCLIKRLFGRTAGLWSLFLLSICPWHIMMSRWGLDANLAPGFLIFGLYFFVRALDQKRFLLLSALFYGLSLYCYAVIWPIVPVLLALQVVYCLYHRKLRVDRWSLLATLFLLMLALPLILFVLVNSEVIPEIRLPFLTIPKMAGYRGSEIALNVSQMWSNLRTALSLLWHQNLGTPYDILLPWGLFYDIGRVFIVIGVAALLKRVITSFLKKTFAVEYFLFVQLLGGGIVCLLVTAKLHQINALYIPLVLSEAYGIWTVTEFLRAIPLSRHNIFKGVRSNGLLLSRLASFSIVAVYLVCLILFQRDYYTDYRELVGAYFAKGLKECVDFSLAQCQAHNLSMITVEKGAQWPRLLLYTETLPSEYLSTVIYDVAPAPASFETRGIHINTRIHYDDISQDSIYIIYYTDVPVFESDFELTQFYDWYVAVPNGDMHLQP